MEKNIIQIERRKKMTGIEIAVLTLMVLMLFAA
jgi:hypothetical protein